MDDRETERGPHAASENAGNSPLSDRVQALVDRLELIPHPEGGWYRESWRSPIELSSEALPPGYPGTRRLMTSIHYLLPTGAESRLHRVRSEELWMHHQGDDLALGVGPTKASAEEPSTTARLGQGAEASLQVIVPAGHWQRATALPGSFGYALVGCVVAPGFEFEDFEMP